MGHVGVHFGSLGDTYSALWHFMGHLHLDPLDLDAPGVGGDVQRGLHVVGDLLPLGQQLVQTLGPQHIPTHGHQLQWHTC